MTKPLGIVGLVVEEIDKKTESAIVALTDPNLEDAGFERGRLAGLREARKAAIGVYEKEAEQ